MPQAICYWCKSKGEWKMKEAQVYTRDFFQNHHSGSNLSAMAVIPLVLELYRPDSVVDVGCGLGEWLVAFQAYGVEDILGIDGDYVDRNILHIPPEHFKALDISRLFTLDRTYDLAICLEVAEHLAPEHATDFVESLTRLAPVILFSAAIPLQDGTNHLNEQWPDYWAQKFRARGFLPIDTIRKKIWGRDDIPVWYRQNILLFCTERILTGNDALNEAFQATNQDMLSIVHPQQYFASIKSQLPAARLRSMIRKIYIAKRTYHALQKWRAALGDVWLTHA
jgi:SAM-dependent methyltransferase